MKISSDQVEGIGFAIPSNEVKITIEQLVKHGKVERPSIGLGLINLSDIPDRYKDDLNTDRTNGVYVAKVSHQDAIKKGDIIIKADGKDIKDDAALRSYLYANKKPGDTMKLTVLRNGNEKEVTVTLGKK